jgi:hypothetical protein
MPLFGWRATPISQPKEATAGSPCKHIMAGRSLRFDPSPVTFFNKGTVQEVGEYLLKHTEFSRVFVNGTLSGVQVSTVHRQLSPSCAVA